MFNLLIEFAAHHKIAPDNKSSKESIVEAIIAKERLTTEAYILESNNTIFAKLDKLIAQVSPLLVASRSSYNQNIKCFEICMLANLYNMKIKSVLRF